MSAEQDKTPRARGRRVAIDWEAVERDYRTDRYTIRELAKLYGVAFQTVQRRAATEGWQRDLREAVRAATNAAVIRETSERAILDATDVVVAAAEVNKAVVLAQRNRVAQATQVTVGLLAELRDAAQLKEHAELLAQILAGDASEIEDVARAKQAIERALSLGNRASTVKALTDALAKQIEIERKSYNLDADPDSQAEKPKPVPFGSVPPDQRMDALMRLLGGAGG